MDIFSPYISDYNLVLNFSHNIMTIHNAFRNGLFDQDNNLCYPVDKHNKDKIYHAHNVIKAKQIYNNFSYNPCVDWDYNFISFNSNEGIILRRRNYLVNEIEITEQNIELEEFFEIYISEESYFQLSTLHDTVCLNTIFVYAILYQNGCTDFYLDLDYYDGCLEEINV